MLGKNTISILDLNDNLSYREHIIDSFCIGVEKASDIRSLFEYLFEKKIDRFNTEDFKGKMYKDDDDILDLILPAIKRVYGKVFIKPPTLLFGKRLELFSLMFDIDEFIDYIVDIIPKSKNSLLIFEEVDRSSETISLIVDNYVSLLFRKSYYSDDIERNIRDYKLKKIIK
jgi:hypothetical protein